MLNPLYHLAAAAIVFFHKGFGPIFGQESFFAWAFSVILLVVCVRIVIFPLFVKQVKSQRTMQMLQPRIKEIREKYKNDKQRMQTEIMALQREHGNPLLGCLPILLQIPLFISLFHVFNSLVPRKTGGGGYHYVSTVGLSAHTVEQISSAKLFGVSLSSAFTSKDAVLKFLGADGTNVKIFAVVLIVLMGATTFFTQKQIMGRTGPVDPQQERVQKILLYVSPLFLVVFGFRFPIAVLLYWLTTNLWSMGQQFFVIRRMPPVVAGSSGTLAASGGRPPAKPGRAQAAVEGPATARPSGAKAKGAAQRAGQAKGTAASRGAAASRGTAASKGGATAKGAAPAKGKAAAGPDLSKNGSSADVTPEQAAKNGAPGDVTPKQAAKNGASSPPAADGDGTGGRQVGANRPRQQPGDGTTPRPPAPVTAGARRPGGSRPAKKRGKGQRRGGRH